MNAVNDPPQIDIDNVLPVREFHVTQFSGQPDSRIVYQQVQPSIFGKCKTHGVLCVLRRSNIEPAAKGPMALVIQLVGKSYGRVLIDVCYDNTCFSFGKTLGQPGTDP